MYLIFHNSCSLVLLSLHLKEHHWAGPWAGRLGPRLCLREAGSIVGPSSVGLHLEAEVCMPPARFLGGSDIPILGQSRAGDGSQVVLGFKSRSVGLPSVVWKSMSIARSLLRQYCYRTVVERS